MCNLPCCGPGHHLVDAVRHDESVRLARCLEDIRSFLCHPSMLEVVLATPQHQRVYSPRVSVPRKDTVLANTKDVNEIAIAC